MSTETPTRTVPPSYVSTGAALWSDAMVILTFWLCLLTLGTIPYGLAFVIPATLAAIATHAHLGVRAGIWVCSGFGLTIGVLLSVFDFTGFHV